MSIPGASDSMQNCSCLQDLCRQEGSNFAFVDVAQQTDLKGDMELIKQASITYPGHIYSHSNVFLYT